MTGSISYIFKCSILLWGMGVLEKGKEGLAARLKVAGCSRQRGKTGAFFLGGAQAGEPGTPNKKLDSEKGFTPNHKNVLQGQ